MLKIDHEHTIEVADRLVKAGKIASPLNSLGLSFMIPLRYADPRFGKVLPCNNPTIRWDSASRMSSGGSPEVKDHVTHCG